VICPTRKAKYFFNEDWTGQITLIRLNKFRSARITESGYTFITCPHSQFFQSLKKLFGEETPGWRHCGRRGR
jgi:hypothetical protein